MTTVIRHAGPTNCYIYGKPEYTIEYTLEENIRMALKMLREALVNRKAGVPNQEYVRWCLKNYRKARDLIEAERDTDNSIKAGSLGDTP